MSFLLQCANMAVAHAGRTAPLSTQPHPTGPADGDAPDGGSPKRAERRKSDFPAFFQNAVLSIMSLAIVEHHVGARWLANSCRTGLQGVETSSPLRRTPDLQHGNLGLLPPESVNRYPTSVCQGHRCRPGSGPMLFCISASGYVARQNEGTIPRCQMPDNLSLLGCLESDLTSSSL
jgi:hypothetical protein